MSLDFERASQVVRTVERTWTSRDAMLYALSVGAGLPDPSADLHLTTENSQDVDLRVLPTMASVFPESTTALCRELGDLDTSKLVHAEQQIQMHADLPPAGTMSVVSRISDVFDKGRGALVVAESRGTLSGTGEHLFTSRSTVFIAGAGGFGGDRGPRVEWSAPEGEPDAVLTYQTSAQQALVYRLNGDRNPLHSDPRFAERAGFAQPILHGLCTYGFAGRALLEALCDNDPSRFGTVSGRFASVVVPGDRLTVAIHRNAGGASFTVTDQHEAVVIDRGHFEHRAA